MKYTNMYSSRYNFLNEDVDNIDVASINKLDTFQSKLENLADAKMVQDGKQTANAAISDPKSYFQIDLKELLRSISNEITSVIKKHEADEVLNSIFSVADVLVKKQLDAGRNVYISYLFGILFAQSRFLIWLFKGSKAYDNATMQVVVDECLNNPFAFCLKYIIYEFITMLLVGGVFKIFSVGIGALGNILHLGSLGVTIANTTTSIAGLFVSIYSLVVVVRYVLKYLKEQRNVNINIPQIGA